MKKYVVLFLITILGLTSFINAEEVPMDAALRYGKLNNGMTYYIRHNEEPKDRASFYIAQNVGAILENDDQNGLAHFLEHMAFNGTKHFEGKGIFKFLEKHGVKFGANINAYTMRDETVYNMSNVPTTVDGLIDSCLLVLNDWSNYLLLTDEEIEAERGVIAEEWRTRRNSRFRISTKQNKAIYYGSKYAERDVIGDLNVIKTFKPETLRDFYHQWYRSDLQAIIVVGDIDVDAVEKSIKTLFSKIPAVENPVKKEIYQIPDNEEAIYTLATDKEATSYYTALMFKSNAVAPENKDKEYLQNSYIDILFSSMMRARFMERLQQENCPYTNASAQIMNLTETLDLSALFTSYKNGAWESSLNETVSMLDNVKKYGFTQGEFERTKKSFLANMENAYKKRDKTNHDQYAKECKNHFIDNTPIPGIKYEFELLKDLFSRLTLEDVKNASNHFLTDENMIIVVSGLEKEGVYYPTKDEVLTLVKKIKTTKQEAYVDTFKDKPLISEEPKSGAIIQRNSIVDNELKATELILSNGIRVLYHQTDIEKQSIRLSAKSWGGTTMLDESEIADSHVLNDFIGSYGLGEFSAIELKKKLTGKIVSTKVSLGAANEYLSASASPKDLETMFQLIYVRFTQPRFDEAAYNALHQRYQAYVDNISNDVKRAFNDSVLLTMANHHSREKLFTKELFSEVSFEGVNEIYKERFANPADFVFSIIGNFDQEILEEYLKKYIASLPTNESREDYKDNGVRKPKSDVTKHFLRELETAKSTVYVNLHKKTSYTEKNKMYAYVISQLLAKRYMKEIREKEGGTYGVSVKSNITKRPINEFQLKFQFDCDPDKVDKLKGIALNEIELLMNGKVIESELEEVKQNILKVKKEGIEKFNYWYRMLTVYATEGETGMNDYEYSRFINSIDSKSVAKQAKKFLKNSIKVEVVMSPK